MDRATCLDKAKECVCGHREQDYGTPENNFAMIAMLWGDYLSIPLRLCDVAAMMALMKIARISTATGQPTEDCWVDLAGYAACGAEVSEND